MERFCRPMIAPALGLAGLAYGVMKLVKKMKSIEEGIKRTQAFQVNLEWYMERIGGEEHFLQSINTKITIIERRMEMGDLTGMAAGRHIHNFLGEYDGDSCGWSTTFLQRRLLEIMGGWISALKKTGERCDRAACRLVVQSGIQWHQEEGTPNNGE